MYSQVIFIITSLLFGLVFVIYQLISFRIQQSIGKAIMVANGEIIVTDAFPWYELGKVMGILFMIMTGTFVLGPIIREFLKLID